MFAYSHNDYYCEQVPLADLAHEVGTPAYIYSSQVIRESFAAYNQAFGDLPHNVCYAVKANSSLAILALLAKEGAGFDIVSSGELARILAAGGKAENTVFSGVGKTSAEMREALDAGVKCFNVESIPELHALNEVAKAAGKRAPVSLRVNPDVDAKTHPYISTGLKSNKFGVAFDDARATYAQAAAMSNLEVVGIDCHIGSQITEISPYLDAVDRLLDLVEQIETDGATIRHVDVGGGLGITYDDETPPDIGEFVRAVLGHIEKRGHAHREVYFEPGRSLVGNAGVLLTRVEYLKPGEEKNFAIVDAAMNDLARPAMYEAFHRIVPVVKSDAKAQTYDVVGPVCESGDWLGRDRELAVEPGDLLAICSAGAYGFVMSSNYNTRPRAAEVMVDRERARLVREREEVRQLFAGESILPD